MKKKVGYQGVPGAYSSLAVSECFPALPSVGFPTFEDVVVAVQRRDIEYALLPIENSTSGRVADLHHLLPGSGLTIIGEHFLPVRHALIALVGTRIGDIRYVYSHREALGQCVKYLRKIKASPVPYGDTAGAVEYIAAQNNPQYAALASEKAASLHPATRILAKNVQDDPRNVTRFLILTSRPTKMKPHKDLITSISFKTRDIPAALFKSLAGFATTGTNIIKLESFVPMARHSDAHFYLEFEGDPRLYPYDIALSELSHYTQSLQILGTYPKSPYRKSMR